MSNDPECAATKAEEERELLLLNAGKHVKMAQVQRSLYQEKVAKAREDALLHKVHSERTYTFVVDYGQNMELPCYNKEQPGVTYYYSPLSVYNLGMVDHAHEYSNGEVSEHLYAHVYHEGVGKKGANNVASLVMKTLRHLNLLREDSVGDELNVIFDNCSGQNKNNTVLKLAAWLKATSFFQKVNFIFLVVGHTKNAADRLFNLLKIEYRRKNLFTINCLITALSASRQVTILPTVPQDFYNYDKLFNDIYQKLDGMIKQNHIFACIDDDKMFLRESNLEEHKVHPHKMSKRGRVMNRVDLLAYTNLNLGLVSNVGINPYKQVELWKNYREYVDPDVQDDELYKEPPAKIMAMVKEEKVTRSTFTKGIKAAKAKGMKETLESAFMDDGKE